jgi:hypothetical protein
MSNEERLFTEEGVCRAASLLCSMPEGWVRDMVRFNARIRVPVAAVSEINRDRYSFDDGFPLLPVQEIPVADAMIAVVEALKKVKEDLQKAHTENQKALRLCGVYRSMLVLECNVPPGRVAEERRKIYE